MPIFQKKQKSSYGLFFLVAIFLFFLAYFVWQAPIWFKGQMISLPGTDSLVARNLANFDVYGLENEKNVVLAPELIKEQATEANIGNKLTPLFYAQIFKIFGDLSIQQLVTLALMLSALAMVIFAFSVFYVFDLKTAIIFSLVYIFFPFVWIFSYQVSTYELSFVFFGLFFVFYFLSQNKKRNIIYLLLAGVFLCLTGLAKEALWLFVPAFFLFLLISKRWKEVILIGISFAVILVCFWLPNLQDNYYFSHLPFIETETGQTSYFGMAGHFFPDPYVYHFEYEEHLAKHQVAYGLNPLKDIGDVKLLSIVGIRQANFYERLVVGGFYFFKHFFKMISIEQCGGPLIFILMLLGLLFLWRQNKMLSKLFVYWLLVALFLLSFITLSNRTHLNDFVFMLALLVSLGVVVLIDLIKEHIKNDKLLKLAQLFIILLIIYNLILSSHFWMDRLYDQNGSLKIEAYAACVSEKNISAQQVIAVPEGSYELNFLTRKSYVMFKPETIERLIVENKLQQAFDYFGVSYVLGYSDELVAQIMQNSQAQSIATDSIEIKKVEMSETKKQFLNFFR